MATTRMARFGWLTARVAASAFVIVILGLTAASADATTVTSPVTTTQHEFVVLCKKYGGTPSRVRSHVVKCDFGGGTTTTCDFNTGVCTDVLAEPRPPAENDLKAGATSGGHAIELHDEPKAADSSPSDPGAVPDSDRSTT